MKAQFVYRENGEIVERGNIVDVLAIDGGWYKIIDDMGQESLLPPYMFDVVSPLPEPPVYNSAVANN